MSVHATSPLPAVAPRHRRPAELDSACPSWCDPRRCVMSMHGGIHIGTPIYWTSTVADVEFSLARYQDVGEPEEYLFTLRRLATSGPVEVTVSDRDLDQLAAIHARLRNDSVGTAEIAGGGAATGEVASEGSSGASAVNG